MGYIHFHAGANKLKRSYKGKDWKDWVIFCLENGYKPCGRVKIVKESDIKTTITNLKSRAELDRCDDCDNYTFVTIVKGREENGNRFSVGECVQCKKGLERLDGEKDVELMMEFRSKHWDAWVTFCLEHGYRPCVE